MSEMEISRDVRPYYGETEPRIRFFGAVAGELVSELWIDAETGEIMQVETKSGHQGNGYASALYRAAAAEMTIYHAPASHRTYEGDRFAQAVGGESLPCTHGCCADIEE